MFEEEDEEDFDFKKYKQLSIYKKAEDIIDLTDKKHNLKNHQKVKQFKQLTKNVLGFICLSYVV